MLDIPTIIDKLAVWTPLGSKIIVAYEKPPDKSGGGILLPDNAKDQITTVEGWVVAVGPEATSLQPGQRILYSRYGHTDVQIDGDDYKTMDQDAVYAVYREAA